MRALWVTLCCALTAVNYVQAEAYRPRDRDDGFNPLDVVKEMPSPMRMFGSSDRRRHDRHRMRPPLHRPPLPGYPGAPYAYPPAVPIPYGPQPYYPGPSIQSGAAAGQAVNAPPQSVETIPVRPDDTHAQPATPADPGMRPSIPDASSQQSGYNFRPVTPLQPNAMETAPLPATPIEAASPAAQAPLPPIPAPALPGDSEEPVMINGKPAVFRPLHLGSESTAE